MYIPGATYRIQFQKNFNFGAFENIIDYLQRLGASTIYASPVFEAVPGSTHGYDVTNPGLINPEIGTLEQLEGITAKLHGRGIGWLQDIVPNHMAYSNHNAWLMDVLKYGTGSRYASYFDIDWAYPFCPGKVMLPILDKPLQEVIEAGELQFQAFAGDVFLSCNGNIYPINPDSWNELFSSQAPTGELINVLNDDKSRIHRLIEQQYYWLCDWRETNRHINYRRFFTINGMICLNVQEQQVFEDYHTLIRPLVQRKTIDGLRVDHIDGLYDPTQYLNRLREMAGEEAYIVVEKILQPGELLPAYWPVQSSTGYDFIPAVTGLLSGKEGHKKLAAFYLGLTQDQHEPAQELADKKELILTGYMQGELRSLCALFRELVSDEKIDEDEAERALVLFLVHCPVYRYYSSRIPLDAKERTELKRTFGEIRKANKDHKIGIKALEHLLLDSSQVAADARIQKVAHFFKRCMQFSGPLMAKGAEDTFMYTYAREMAHNEVGDAPTAAGIGAGEFHEAMRQRNRLWRKTMNATATHDTKHGEDARARLCALPEMADEWISAVGKWQILNEVHRRDGIPDRNEEYFIYQALIAHYPMPGDEDDSFKSRFQAYIQKALREAKIHTNWTPPDTAYEDAVAKFVANILEEGNPFLDSFLTVHRRIAEVGVINSLSQLILKCTCPGIPDIYNGTELWDLNMVDPDNRRLVDFDLRSRWLDEILTCYSGREIQLLWDDRYSGKIKLWLLHELLNFRHANQELFADGLYLPLEVTGKYKKHLLAYMRCHGDQCVIVAVPLHISQMGEMQYFDWEDTAILIPDGIDEKFRDALLGSVITSTEELAVKGLFTLLPFAILKGNQRKGRRAAGILLPVSSLPSLFGIGDFGKGARVLVDFLVASKQQYWQLLPLSPVNTEGMYSPYSSRSSMACNPLLISPELLAEERLMDKASLKAFYGDATDCIDYATVEIKKMELINAAYANFRNGNYTELEFAFDEYCRREDDWLHDYALFIVLKTIHNSLPWYQWPHEYKWRDASALAEVDEKFSGATGKIKWTQFIAERQWQQLKAYCTDRQIKLFGDMPFYISYDSADVWSHPDLFNLDASGNMAGTAGVPPDYFSKDGQLWNVPTYNWNKLREGNYSWWARRLRKNIALFDLVRIDHFRAFESYWEVPAGEKTARKGAWVKGPGLEFFDFMKRLLGKLPFVAEDLGEEMEDVYALREKTGLPGMKVLQYAWGNSLGTSVDIPHNYINDCIVYTGTHDNNTTRGWYRQETNDNIRKYLRAYTGKEINKSNVHEVMAALAYASVARIAILPIQDVLGLDERSRINTPGKGEGNWQWRMPSKAFTNEVADYLRKLTTLYDRR